MSQKQVEYLFKYISQKWQTKLSHKDVGQSCDILQRFQQQRTRSFPHIFEKLTTFATSPQTNVKAF